MQAIQETDAATNRQGKQTGKGKMNRIIKIKAISFCVLAGALIASWPAAANTIFLTCPGAPYGDVLTVDLTNNTVNNVPATINATAFDWQTRNDYGGGIIRTKIWHIDRAAGTLKFTLSTQFANGHVASDTVSAPARLVARHRQNFRPPILGWGKARSGERRRTP